MKTESTDGADNGTGPAKAKRKPRKSLEERMAILNHKIAKMKTREINRRQCAAMEEVCKAIELHVRGHVYEVVSVAIKAAIEATRELIEYEKTLQPAKEQEKANPSAPPEVEATPGIVRRKRETAKA